MKVVLKSINELKTYQPGAEIPINDEDFKEIKKSVEKYGFVTPIVIKNNIIVDGLNRLRVADSLGITTIPCIEINSNSDPQTLAIVLNLARRHLTQEQKIYLISALIDLYEQNKKKKPSQTPNTQVDNLSSAPSDQTTKTVDTQVDNLSSATPDINSLIEDRTYGNEKGMASKIAAVTGVSPTTVKKVKLIKTDPEKLKEVVQGQKSLEQAYLEVKNRNKEKEEFFKEQAQQDREERKLIEPNPDENVKKVKEIYREIRNTLLSGTGVITQSVFAKLIVLCIQAVDNAIQVFNQLPPKDQEKIKFAMDKLIKDYQTWQEKSAAEEVF